MSNNLTLDDLRNAVSKMLDGRDPHRAISATVAFQVKRNRESRFTRNADDLAEATRELPGLTRFVYHREKSFVPGQDGGDSIRYLIYENWVSTDRFRAQWDSAHLKHFQESVFDLLAGPPELQFYGGDEPVGDARPFQTGLKRCWDSVGKPIVDAKGTGQDGEIRAGVEPPDPRFTDNQDGTVTDNLTGLHWLKDANSFGEVPWEQGLAIVKSVASGSHGLSDGSLPGDWRVPNVNELLSLVDLDSETGAAIPDVHPFENTAAANYWTSSTVSSAPPLGWYVAIAVGPPVFDLKINPMRIWPVRGKGFGRIAKTGQTKCFNSQGEEIACAGTGQDGDLQWGVPFPSPRYVENGDGTVTDNLTGLVWLRDANAFGTRNWDDALASCNSLSNGNAGLSDGSKAGDWRLPNIKEMRSIIDYDHFGPALGEDHPFHKVRTSLYWSSTTIASAPNQARFVFVGLGPSVWDHKSVELGVWPVRNA